MLKKIAQITAKTVFTPNDKSAFIKLVVTVVKYFIYHLSPNSKDLSI